MQHNQASAEIHNHAPSGALVVGAILAGFGLACLALVYVQGTIYTRESQLTRERSEYMQQQIVELRDRVSDLDGSVQLAESRIQRIQQGQTK